MTQEFKLKSLDDFPSHFLISAITYLSKEDSIKLQNRDKSELDIEFKVNGIELDFEKTINNWHERMMEHVNEKAYELVKNKVELKDILKTIDDFNERVVQFENDLDVKIRELFGVKGEYE